MTAGSFNDDRPSGGALSAPSLNDAAPQTGGVRFAPSPTGLFHLGNLRTAWVSWTLAQHLSLPWVVRFEDIDEPRILAGARERQLHDLAALGMRPDVELLQSKFKTRHQLLFELAKSTGSVYACDCSRREVQHALAGLASAPHDATAPVYSGHCRSKNLSHENTQEPESGFAWRFKMPDQSGHHDFIIARTRNGEFTPAYHWACAIDDFDGAYDWIVRSSDLATALPLQAAIQSWIARATNTPRPRIRAFHTALITQDDGHRLEKRTAGVTLLELDERGFDAARLIEIFERSFSMPAELTGSSAVNGADVYEEREATLTVSRLLASNS